jgi:hypothetical protein
MIGLPPSMFCELLDGSQSERISIQTSGRDSLIVLLVQVLQKLRIFIDSATQTVSVGTIYN